MKVAGFKETFDALAETELVGERFAAAFCGPGTAWTGFVVWLQSMMRVAAQKESEDRRVADILARDSADAATEAERQAAMIQVAEGLTVNIGNTVIPPTPEWLAKGESRTFAVDGERWTDMPVATVRRVETSHARRAFNAGRITARQDKACEWYEEQHELSGLAGNVPSSSFEPRIAGGINGGSVFSPSQIDAQDELRNARLLIPLRLRMFFDLVVIDRMAMKAASRKAYAGRDALDSFRCCADRVADYVEYSTGKNL